MIICGVEFEVYKCIDCGTDTINNQASGPKCKFCHNERLNMASPGQLRAEKRIKLIETRIDEVVTIIYQLNTIVGKIVDLLPNEEIKELYNEYENADGSRAQSAHGHGAENVKADNASREILTWGSDEVPAEADADGDGEDMEPDPPEEGGSGDGDKVGIEDKELCEADGGKTAGLQRPEGAFRRGRS